MASEGVPHQDGHVRRGGDGEGGAILERRWERARRSEAYPGGGGGGGARRDEERGEVGGVNWETSSAGMGDGAVRTRAVPVRTGPGEPEHPIGGKNISPPNLRASQILPLFHAVLPDAREKWVAHVLTLRLGPGWG